MPGNLGSLPTLEIIASWPTPNYEHPHEQRTWLVSFSIVVLVVVTVMVAIRIFTRARKMSGPFGLDDIMLIPGYLLTIPFTIICCVGIIYYGVDRHVYDVPPSLWAKAALVAWLSFFFFLLSTTFTKVSVLLFYRRLSSAVVSPAWKYATVAAIWFTVLSTLVFILLLIFTCNPTEAYWRSYDPTYSAPFHCTDTRSVNVVAGVVSTFSDLYSVVLPIGMIRQIEASRRQKIALNVVFAAGLLVVAAGCVRTYYLYQLSYSYDSTWMGYDTFIWGLVEMQLALVCASAPALRVFFTRFFGSGAGEKTEIPSDHETGPYGNFSAHGGPGPRAMASYTSLESAPGHHQETREVVYDDKSQYPSRTRDNRVQNYDPPPRPCVPEPTHHVEQQARPATQQVRYPTPTGQHVTQPTKNPAPPAQFPVRTPADFEAFALRELEKTRLAHAQSAAGAVTDKQLPPRPQPDKTPPEVVQLHPRRFHDTAEQRPQSMRSTLSGPFEDPFHNPYPT